MATPFYERQNKMQIPNFRGWTEAEIAAYNLGCKNGIEIERQACLDDCNKVYERLDDRESSIAIQSCIEEIEERAEKENV